MPRILSSLQKSIQAVLTGKTHPPDWLSHGVREQSKVLSVTLSDLTYSLDSSSVSASVGSTPLGLPHVQPSFACDGQYLYIHGNRGLAKVGSGYANSVLVSMYTVR